MLYAYAALRIVNDDPELNSENVIKKINDEFYAQRWELQRKWEAEGDDEIRREHACLKNHHEAWRKSGFSFTHQFFHYDDRTILHLAMISHSKNLIKALKEKGADIDTIDGKKFTPLHTAIRMGDEDMMEFLLENGANMYYDGTPLYHAVAGGHKHMVEFFLQKGVDINARLNSDCPFPFPFMRAEGGNCLHLAVAAACDVFSTINHMVEKLEEQGIITDKTQKIKNYYQTIDYFRDKSEGIREVEQRQKNYTEIIELLIDRGIDINAKNVYGQAPIHCSVDYGGHIEVARILIRKGVDINAQSAGKTSPLHVILGVSRAMNPYLTETAILFIESGADVKAKNAIGVTPLHIASLFSEVEVMKALIQKGADVNARTRLGRTPLHDVVYGSEKAICLLIKNKANTWARFFSFYPLHYTPSPVSMYAYRWAESEEEKRRHPDKDYSDCMSEPGYLMKFKYAYDKQFNAFFATMLLGAAAVYALFATDSLVCDTPRVVGAVAIVTAAAFAAGRITYEIFKPSTKMEEVEQQEPSVEGYKRLR